MSSRTVLVVGTGLIGTSIGLALRARAHHVFLSDVNEEHVAHAARLGAGQPHGTERVDLAVVAVPPRSTGAVVAALLRRDIAPTVSDTASIKARPRRDLEAALAGHAGGPRAAQGRLPRYVGGHPLAGGERAGPHAARADLFAGRPWVLTPQASSSAKALEDARWLVAECGSTALLMTAEEHDRALALTSHAPQLVASALAAQLAAQPDAVLGLVGQGLRDMTRIAASDPRLWADIGAGNAAPIADAIDALTRELSDVSRELRGTASAAIAVRRLVEAGRAGHRRIPGKHGGSPRTYRVVPVVVPDQPGQLARLFADAAAAAVNIEDLRVDHAPGLPVGVIELFVGPESADHLRAALAERGWTVTVSDEAPPE